MTKKVKSLIITASVMVIALVAYMVTYYIVTRPSNGTVTTSMLTEINSSNVASVEVVLQNGDSYIVTENAEDEDTAITYKITFNGVYEGLRYDASDAKNLVTISTQLVSTRNLGIIEEGDYVLYGLNNPQSVVTVNLLDNTQKKIYVGNKNIAKGDYYCRLDGDENLYTISGYSGGILSASINSVRISEFILPFEEYEEIDVIEWKHKDGEQVVIKRQLEKTIYNPFTNYVVTHPWQVEMPVNVDLFVEMVKTMKTLQLADYITPKLDGSAINLKDYGLDDPWGYYKITTVKGKVQEFSFGNYIDDLEYYSYMLDHSTNDIYTVYRGSVAWIEKYDALSVTTPYIINAYLNNIETLTIIANGETNVLKHIKRYYSQAEIDEMEANGQTVNTLFESKYRFNDFEYPERTLSLLYMSTTGTRIHVASTKYEHEDEPDLILIYNPFDIDEPERKIEFYKLKENENFYAAYIDGKQDFIVSETSVQTVINDVEIVKNGGTPEYVP